MPNHVHLLLTPIRGFELEDILQSRKRQSARELNQAMNFTGPLWQKHSYDHIVRDGNELLAFQDYIRQNPVEAGLGKHEWLHRASHWELTGCAD